jgi:hypothetical protein
LADSTAIACIRKTLLPPKTGPQQWECRLPCRRWRG